MPAIAQARCTEGRLVGIHTWVEEWGRAGIVHAQLSPLEQDMVVSVQSSHRRSQHVPIVWADTLQRKALPRHDGPLSAQRVRDGWVGHDQLIGGDLSCTLVARALHNLRRTSTERVLSSTVVYLGCELKLIVTVRLSVL